MEQTFFETVIVGQLFNPVDTNDIIKRIDDVTVCGVYYNAFNITRGCLDFVADDHEVYIVRDVNI